MIKFYFTENGSVESIDEPKKGCWIAMTHPNEKELEYISKKYNIEYDDLSAALDEEESSRIETEDNYNMLLVDIPTNEERNGKKRYVTIPLGIITTDEAVITVCLEKTPVLDFSSGKKFVDTSLKTRFLLKVLLNNAQIYLKDLRMIYRQAEELEKKLQHSTDNPALIDMMELGKSLLYFSASLKANTIILEKLIKNPAIKKYEEDEDLLEDVIIENKQAVETTEMYSSILNGTMDAYASIISNNMNVVQKFLAVATIILSIPNIVSGFYGMNINGDLPLSDNPYGFYIIIGISVLISFVVYLYFKIKK